MMMLFSILLMALLIGVLVALWWERVEWSWLIRVRVPALARSGSVRAMASQAQRSSPIARLMEPRAGPPQTSLCLAGLVRFTSSLQVLVFPNSREELVSRSQRSVDAG